MASQGLRRWLAVSVVRLTVAAFSLPVCGVLATGPTAAADDQTSSPAIPHSVDGVLQRLDVKAKPSEPPPEFVTRTRPNPSRLHYMPTAVPHAVSAVPVKTPAQIQAAEEALDAAQARQLNPTPAPVDLTKHSTASKPPKTKDAKAKPAGTPD